MQSFRYDWEFTLVCKCTKIKTGYIFNISNNIGVCAVRQNYKEIKVQKGVLFF